MGQQVTHFEVVGQDADALRSFFGEMFGWKFSAPMGPTDYSVLEEQEGIGGGIGAGPEGYSGHVTFYVQVDDVGAALEKAESLGGTRMMGPDSGARGRDRDRALQRPRGSRHRSDRTRVVIGR